MLSVSELRQRKQQLEQAIAELIQVFEHETSVEVDSLLTLNAAPAQPLRKTLSLATLK